MPNTSVISKTAYEEYGLNMKVGAGAFKYGETENELTDVFLVANNNYFLQDSYGNKLPYLDSVHFHFNESKMIELEMFIQKKLSLIHKPKLLIAIVPNRASQRLGILYY